MSNPNVLAYKGQRVLTTERLAAIYGTQANNIRNNYSNSRDNFIEGVHYFYIEGEELRALKRDINDIDIVAPNVNLLYLWTHRGASRHCKILGTPKAWEQFDVLEESYFRPKEVLAPIDPATLTAVTGFVKVMGRLMERRGDSPQKVIEMAGLECRRCGIPLPVDFAKNPRPGVEQLALTLYGA